MWHRIVVFGRLGKICGEHLSKGRQVFIKGSAQTRDWGNKDGIKRYTSELVASQMQMLGSRDSYCNSRGSGGRVPESAFGRSYSDLREDNGTF